MKIAMTRTKMMELLVVPNRSFKKKLERVAKRKLYIPPHMLNFEIHHVFSFHRLLLRHLFLEQPYFQFSQSICSSKWLSAKSSCVLVLRIRKPFQWPFQMWRSVDPCLERTKPKRNFGLILHLNVRMRVASNRVTLEKEAVLWNILNAFLGGQYQCQACYLLSWTFLDLHKKWIVWVQSDFTLLWLSILAWIFPSRIKVIKTSSKDATEVLKELAIKRKSADEYGLKGKRKF